MTPRREIMGDTDQDRCHLHQALTRLAPAFGFTPEIVDALVVSARIVTWKGVRTKARSSDGSTVVHLLIRGCVVVEVLVSPDLFSSPRRRRGGVPVQGGVLKLVPAGEIFCLTPVPASRSYELRARAHPNADGDDVAVVAIWGPDAMRDLMGLLGPEGHFRLLNESWLSLSRISEEREVLLALPVIDRLRFILRRLARRFPRSHASGTLIDLKLPNPFLGRLIGANRFTVSRALGQLAKNGEVIRIKDLVVVPLPTPAKETGVESAAGSA
jgi:hypothetical protein